MIDDPITAVPSVTIAERIGVDFKNQQSTQRKRIEDARQKSNLQQGVAIVVGKITEDFDKRRDRTANRWIENLSITTEKPSAGRHGSGKRQRG